MSIWEFIGMLFGSGVINSIISHILYSKKLKKDLESMGNNLIAQDIQKSLQFVRDVELKLTEIEIYGIEDPDNDVDFFNPQGIYLSIFNDNKSFDEFRDLIGQCRKNHEKNLNYKIALNLAYIEKYLYTANSYIKENGDGKYIKFWGTVFIFDLQKWQVKMDKILVDEINKHNYKLVTHNPKKWNKKRDKEITKQYNNTVLHILCDEIKNEKEFETKEEICTISLLI